MKNMEKEIKLPRLLGEGCVLQRGPQTRIWGWYDRNRKITASFQGKQYVTETEDDGSFELLLECSEAGGPYTLELAGDGGQTRRLDEVYVGDVFVCSGQSNMELPMSRVKERFPEEFLRGGCKEVHHYKVTECAEFDGALKDHRDARWTPCTGEYLSDVSAFAYFFGCMMQEKEQVPIGLINISLGGTPAEAWMSAESLEGYPDLMAIRSRYSDPVYREKLLKRQEEAENRWHQALREQERATEGAEWKPIPVPCFFQEEGPADFCGLLHLKYTFTVPEHLCGSQALLRLGTMTDSDDTYINGVKVGETGYCYPPRRYEIPAGILKGGDNEILIRLACRDGKGRITPDKPYEIVFPSGECISLEGTWQYQIRAVSEPAPELEFMTRKPTVMFQGMTAPCLPATVKGVLWYQGESNEHEPDRYEALLKGLIADWRNHWKQEKLPFTIIQLPACGLDNAGNGAWAVIREAQKQASMLPDVAMTVNLDLGEYNDLHPVDKKGVAHRAFLAARSLMYGEDTIWQGPEPVSFEVGEKELILVFDTKDGGNLGLIHGSTPGEFEVAGPDGIFCRVQGRLDGEKVRLETEHLSEIIAVRYAWSDAPSEGLLCNGEGLPAAPFYLRINTNDGLK
ncbi:MAG: sialate O-acetylesterase [Lachnospiraceae bacterium]